MKNKKGGHSVTGVLKMGVNVAAHDPSRIFRECPPGTSRPPGGPK